MQVYTFQIDAITVDDQIQSRVKLNDEYAEECAAEIRDGKVFPPVTVFHDGEKYWLADGFHRLRAHVLASCSTIRAEVRTGTKRDAIWHSVGCNATHGLRRTNEDKRKSVLMLMHDEVWKNWSDNKIAKACGVSQPFVSTIRKELVNNGYNFQMEREKIDPNDPNKRSIGYMAVVSKRLKDKIRSDSYRNLFNNDSDKMEALDAEISTLEKEIGAMRETLKIKRKELSLLEAQRFQLWTENQCLETAAA